MREKHRGFEIVNGVIYEDDERVHQVETNEDAKEWIDWALDHKRQDQVLLILDV